MKVRIIIFHFVALLFLFCPPIGVSTTLKEIHNYIDSHRNYEALKKLQEIIPEENDIPLYYYLKGKALMGVKRYTEAIDYLNRAYIMAPHRVLKENAMFERGRAYFKQGFYYEAASNFKNFLDAFPDSAYKEDATLLYAQSLVKIEDFVRALVMFKKIPEDRPESIFGKAEVFQKLGLYKSANALYNKGFIEYRDYLKKNPHLLYTYTENLLMIGKYNEAKNLLYSLVDTPLIYKAYIGLGIIEYTKNNFSVALNYFKKTVDVPDRLSRRKAMLYVAKSLIKLNKKDKAKRFLHELVKEFPYTDETKEAILLLSSLYREDGEFLKASRFLNELLFSKTPDKKTLNELKMLVLDSSQRDRRSFLKIWEKSGLWLFSSQYEDLLLDIAESFIDNNDGDFLRIYNFLLKEGSKKGKTEAISNMIVFYAELQLKERVASLMKKLQKIKTKNDSVYRAYAWNAYLNGEPKITYKELQKIKKVRNKDMELLLKVKEGAPSVSSFENLYKRYCQDISVKPDYEMLGDLYFEKGKMARAIKLYRLAMKRRQDDPGLLFKIGFFENEIDLLKKINSSEVVYSKVSRVSIKECDVINRLRSL